MRARLNALFYFVLTIAAVLLTLKVLNWLPFVLDQETLRPYAGIEEVRSKLNLRDILVPSYFPETITWPPAKILAQAKPYPGVLMVFNKTGKQDDFVLVISESTSGDFPGGRSLPSLTVKQKVPYELVGRKALLEAGACDGREPCSRIIWTEDRLHIMILMKDSPVELIRIAESMLR